MGGTNSNESQTKKILREGKERVMTRDDDGDDSNNGNDKTSRLDENQFNEYEEFIQFTDNSFYH